MKHKIKMECEYVRNLYPEKKIEPCCESCHKDYETGRGDDLWYNINGMNRNVCCAIMCSFCRNDEIKENNDNKRTR